MTKAERCDGCGHAVEGGWPYGCEVCGQAIIDRLEADLAAAQLQAAMACANPCGDCHGCHLAHERHAPGGSA